MKRLYVVVVCSLLGACVSKVRVEPVTVQPIHVTVDVNVHDAAPPEPKR